VRKDFARAEVKCFKGQKERHIIKLHPQGER